MSCVYRWVDHTGELELEILAPDEPLVFEEALAAIFELTAGDGGNGSEDEEPAPRGERSRAAFESREVVVVAPDRATLLAGWLEDLLFLAETEDFVPVRVTRLELTAERLSATIEGRRGRPRHLVKAVTYHGLRFERQDHGWRAGVVLDV
jgi:SHS2 domain-containing protein